jgi:hypothetical protein
MSILADFIRRFLSRLPAVLFLALSISADIIRFRISVAVWIFRKFQKKNTFICIYQKIVVPLHRLL